MKESDLQFVCCDYTICGDKDPYIEEHPEYRDEAGYRRNK